MNPHTESNVLRDIERLRLEALRSKAMTADERDSAARDLAYAAALVRRVGVVADEAQARIDREHVALVGGTP